jgi:hypothetical protein
VTPKKWLPIVIVGGAVGWVVALVLALALYLHIDTRQWLQPSDFVPQSGADESVARVFAGLHDVSASVCGAGLPCTQAYAGDNLTLYKFDSKVVARAFTRENTQTRYDSDWIVIEFTNPDLSAGDKQFAEMDVDEAWIAE